MNNQKFENIGNRKFLISEKPCSGDTRTMNAWISFDCLGTGKTLVIRLPTLNHEIAVREGRHLLWLIERNEYLQRRVKNLETYLADECEVDLALISH